jgi:hypothetical protein
LFHISFRKESRFGLAINNLALYRWRLSTVDLGAVAIVRDNRTPTSACYGAPQQADNRRWTA